jgi:hypothetical protein
MMKTPAALSHRSITMAAFGHADGMGLVRLSCWLVALACLPAMVMWLPARPSIMPHATTAAMMMPAANQQLASIPPPSIPRVDPPTVYAIDAARARTLNGAIPFADRVNPAASPFQFMGGAGDLARATDCLASAQIYEAGDDSVGERAVAQVVLNRVRHPAFPKTICGVVFEGQERRTGCQFTFTCDGALARTPSPAAWERARAIARSAIGGAVFGQVGLATHYHTDWVIPYWSRRLDKTARVGTHLFFRWTGWWGTPAAFQRSVGGVEPFIGRIARLSLAHRDGVANGAVEMAAATSMARTTPSMLPKDRDYVPATSKSWTPAPAIALPGGVRRDDPIEIADDGARRGKPVAVALVGLPR